LTIGHRQNAHLAGLRYTEKRQKSGGHHGDPPFAHILQRGVEIPIRDVGHVDAGPSQEARKGELRHTGCGSPIELAGLGACPRLQDRKGIVIHRRIGSESNKRIRAGNDRHQIALGIVRKLVDQDWIDGDRPAERKSCG